MLPFEEAYQPKRWDLRQLGFVCALAMTNAHLGYNYFVRHKSGDGMWSKAEFTRELARGLVQNSNLVDDADGGDRPKRTRQLPEGCSLVSKTNKYARAGHELCRIQTYRGRWNGKEFPKIRTEYSKLRCSWGCGALIRTFCRCNCNLMLCPHCYGEHIASLNLPKLND